MCINCPKAMLILASISRSFWVFVWGPEAEFLLNRSVAYNFKKIFEGAKVFALFWKLAEFVKRCN
jgi:hypothetical protein